jgi:hypothetical protein
MSKAVFLPIAHSLIQYILHQVVNADYTPLQLLGLLGRHGGADGLGGAFLEAVLEGPVADVVDRVEDRIDEERGAQPQRRLHGGLVALLHAWYEGVLSGGGVGRRTARGAAAGGWAWAPAVAADDGWGEFEIFRGHFLGGKETDAPLSFFQSPSCTTPLFGGRRWA